MILVDIYWLGYEMEAKHKKAQMFQTKMEGQSGQGLEKTWNREWGRIGKRQTS